MNNAMIEAIRREAFVQGWLHAIEEGMISDAYPERLTAQEILDMMPTIDKEYARYRKHRSSQ